MPNGPLSVACPCSPDPCGPAALAPPGLTDEFVSCRVSNVHQPWRDHVVYRDNPEDVVSRWVGEIAARAKKVPPSVTERPRRPTDNAERARELRRRRGVRVLAEQSLTAILGMFAIIWHWSEMDELGRIAAHRLPFLRSLLGKVSDFVPEGFRDGVFGGSRDSSHLQGLVVALGIVLIVVWLEGRFASSRQSSATGHYLAGDPDKDLTGVGWLVAATVLGLAVVLAFGWVMPHHLKDTPTRIVHVHPALISTEGGVGHAQRADRGHVRPGRRAACRHRGRRGRRQGRRARPGRALRRCRVPDHGHRRRREGLHRSLLAGHRSEERHRGLRSVRHRPAQGRRDPHGLSGRRRSTPGRRTGSDAEGTLKISDPSIKAMLAREREEPVVLIAAEGAIVDRIDDDGPCAELT